MPEAVLCILGEEIRLECALSEKRRIEDLAAALEARLNEVADCAALRRLVLVALSLLDENQAAGAALARAHGEIEHLNDLFAEAHIDPAPEPEPVASGRVASLSRRAQSVA